MRIEADVRVQLDAPDEQEGGKYLGEILDDISKSTIISFTYQVGTTREVPPPLNTARLAAVITALLHAGVIEASSIGLVPDEDTHLTPGIESWLRS